MDPQGTKTVSNDALFREMERRSLDTFMVYNPTDTDYLLEWDKHYHRIPAKDKDLGFGKGKMELSRYLTEKYAREMKNHLINIMIDTKLAETKAKLLKAGAQDVVLNANLELERQHELRTDNEELIKKYYAQCVLGLVREYGMDAPELAEQKKTDPTKTIEEVTFESMNKRYQEPTQYEAEIVEEPKPVQTSTEPVTVDEVTA